MYTSKSFCNITSYVSNVAGVVSPVGEITPDALTYSSEIGMYKHATLKDYTLYTLKSVDDNGNLVMNQTLVNEGVQLSNRITTYIAGITGQVFYDELLTNIIAYAQTLSITTITLGPVVQHGGVWFPDWVKWTSTAYGSANENTIWFSISALANQYSDYEIVIVPPVDVLNNFFQSYAAVQTMVNAITFSQTMTRVQAARGTHPPTVIRTDPYNYINPLNSAQTLSTGWSILIYGPAGNNVDAIKDALVAYILANSTHDRAAWTQIFPDIFKRTEFILAPHWYQYAITPRQIDPIGIYSPLVNVNHVRPLLQGAAPQYSSSHIAAHASTFGAPYESIAISVVGGIANRLSLFELSQVFADYINVGTGSADFNRMGPDTQSFCNFLGDMLPVAESMDSYSEVPAGFTRLTRDGVLYLVKSFENIQYLLVSKQSVDAIATAQTWIS